MLVSFVYVVACRLFAFVLLLARSDRSKELEILLLRHELSILRRQARRPQLAESDRLVFAALSRVLPRRSWQAFLVTPELILRLAREKSHWGYVRIVGELLRTAGSSGGRPGRLCGYVQRRAMIRRCQRRSVSGVRVSATLVRNVLARAGVRPAPERGASSWRSFLRDHGDSILACDLFTVDTVWLRQLYVLFFVSIGTRRIEYVACTSKPDTAWMTQQARNLLMDLGDSQPLPDPRPRHEVQPHVRQHLPQRRH